MSKGIKNYDSKYHPYFEILRDEYKSIRDASLAMEGKLGTLKSATVTIFAGIIAIYSLPIKVSIYILLLISSMIFAELGLIFSYIVRQILILSRYENKILKPKIENYLQNQTNDKSIKVLEWQDFYLSPIKNQEIIKKIVHMMHEVGNVLFSIGLAIGPLIIFIYLKYDSRNGWSRFEKGLFIIDVVLIFALMLLILYEPINILFEKSENEKKHMNDDKVKTKD